MRLIVLLLAAVASAQVRIPGPGGKSPGTLYSYERSLTIDHTKCGSADSTNFPVLVSLTSTSLKTVANGGHVQNASGYDIVFFSDSALTSMLNFEVRFYDATTGQIIIWVMLPTVSASVDTVFYVGYGNSTISTSQENISGVWNSNYKAAYHLDDNAASTTVVDSTSNANNATNVANTSTKTTTGQVNTALTFNGSTDSASAPSISAINNAQNVSFTGWVKINTLVDGGAFIIKSNGANTQRFGIEESGAGVGSANTAILITAQNGASNSWGNTASGLVTTGTWYHFAGTYDGSQSGNANRLKFYLNGVSQTLTFTGTIPSTIANTGDAPIMGDGSGGAKLNGILDETRIVAATLSADWVLTEYNNQNNPGTFITLGAETTP